MLEIDSLVRRYRNGRGLGPFTLSVESGEIVGVVGPNGAGKTTLFSILAGILAPQSGSVLFDGRDGGGRAPVDRLGFLPEASLVPREFTPLQAVQFEAAMRGSDISKEDALKQLSLFAATSYRNRLIASLSQGQAKRVELACAFVGQPRLLILDEPLNGLDIQSVIDLRTRVREVKDAGAAVLISSHILSFLDETADRIVFLRDGLVAEEISMVGNQAAEHAEEAYARLFLQQGE